MGAPPATPHLPTPGSVTRHSFRTLEGQSDSRGVASGVGAERVVATWGVNRTPWRGSDTRSVVNVCTGVYTSVCTDPRRPFRDGCPRVGLWVLSRGHVSRTLSSESGPVNPILPVTPRVLGRDGPRGSLPGTHRTPSPHPRPGRVVPSPRRRRVLLDPRPLRVPQPVLDPGPVPTPSGPTPDPGCPRL